MPTEENDYSYEEYLKNFREAHLPQERFMSKDQFEAAAKLAKMKAAEEAKMKAAEEAGTIDWWEQEGGPAEETIKKYGNTTSADIAEQSIPYQRGQAKGNQGDNINNPDKLNTAEITKLQQETKKLFGQKDSYTPEEIEAAKNSAGITKEVPGSTSSGSTSAANTANNALTNSVSDVATPKKGDPPEVGNAKKQYNKAMMSIWDAYRHHLIDKETAGYFTIDAIATLAKNLGRSIGNVGAQFSGGTIDNGHDTSMWEQRRDSIFNTELQKETEGIDTFENKFKQLSYNRNSTINDLMKAVKSDAEKLSDNNPLKIAYLSLAAMIASGQVDGTTTIAATSAKGINELFDFFQKKNKKKDKKKDKK